MRYEDFLQLDPGNVPPVPQPYYDMTNDTGPGYVPQPQFKYIPYADFMFEEPPFSTTWESNPITPLDRLQYERQTNVYLPDAEYRPPSSVWSSPPSVQSDFTADDYSALKSLANIPTGQDQVDTWTPEDYSALDSLKAQGASISDAIAMVERGIAHKNGWDNGQVVPWKENPNTSLDYLQGRSQGGYVAPNIQMPEQNRTWDSRAQWNPDTWGPEDYAALDNLKSQGASIEEAIAMVQRGVDHRKELQRWMPYIPRWARR